MGTAPPSPRAGFLASKSRSSQSQPRPFASPHFARSLAGFSEKREREPFLSPPRGKASSGRAAQGVGLQSARRQRRLSPLSAERPSRRWRRGQLSPETTEAFNLAAKDTRQRQREGGCLAQADRERGESARLVREMMGSGSGGGGGGGSASGIVGRNLYIHNVSKEASEKDVYEFFSKCGEVESVCLRVNQRVGPNAVYAFVLYRRPEDAKRCFETLNGKSLCKRGREAAALRGSLLWRSLVSANRLSVSLSVCLSVC